MVQTIGCRAGSNDLREPAIKKSKNNFGFSCFWFLNVVYCRVLDGHPGLIKNEELRINSWVHCSLKIEKATLLSLGSQL